MYPSIIRTTILVIFAITLLFKTLQSLRAHRLKERYVLVFVLTSVPFLVLALWPGGIVFLYEHMEMEKPTFMVLALAVFLILLIFELLSIVSQQDRKIASLAQMVGLLMEREKMVDRGMGGPTQDARVLVSDSNLRQPSPNSAPDPGK